MNKNIEFFETGKIKKGLDIILGIPDVGLVGTIAATHIIDELKLEEVAYMESDIFPPITVVHGHAAKSPLRFYGNDEIMIFISEMPVPPVLVNTLAKALVEWFKEKGFKRVVSVGGVARQDRMDIENPEVYALPSDDEMLRVAQKANLKIFEEGLLVGSYSTLLRMCMRENIHSIYMMAESHMNYPDPGAAASAVDAINKVLGLNVEVKTLKDKAEEIRIKAKDLMKRTGSAMREMQKTQEQEIPMMYR